MICNTENQAAFLEPAFWRGELGEAQFTCFLCPVMWRKLAERFFLYYCCRWHNCYIILEPFEKPVYSSVAPFPLCWIEHRVASGSTGFSPAASEKSGCPPNFQRIRQNVQRQHRIPRGRCTVFMQRINLGFWNHIWWPEKFVFLCVSDPVKNKVKL